jgi:hypothetical protein
VYQEILLLESEGEFVVSMAGQELNSKSISDVTYEREWGGVCHYLHVISRRRAGTECRCGFCSNYFLDIHKLHVLKALTPKFMVQ